MNFPGLAAPAVAALLAEDRRLVVTGASGWLGSAVLELIRRAIGEEAFHARVRCFGSTARTLRLRGFSVAQRPLSEISDLPAAPTWVLHLAFLTKDKVEGMSEPEYETANAGLSGVVLRALEGIGATGVFVASSGAARSADDPDASHAMRLYGRLKKADETAFAAWAEEMPGRTAVIARVFNVAGPYINKPEHYALAAFVLDALSGRPVRVRAPHRVVRGFASVRDLWSLVLLLLSEEGGGAVRFDTGGEPLELGDAAARVSDVLGGPGVERAVLTSDREDCYVGDPSRWDEMLADRGIVPMPFAEQVRETADYLVAEAERTG